MGQEERRKRQWQPEKDLSPPTTGSAGGERDVGTLGARDNDAWLGPRTSASGRCQQPGQARGAGRWWSPRASGQEHKLPTPRGMEPMFYNNCKWSIAFKNHKSLYCTPVTYIILYSYYTSI